jgi:hypothetical protein
MQGANKQPLQRRILLLIHRFMFAISRKHNRNDVQVAMFPLDKSHTAAFSKIDEAFNLISEFDPRRYFQIKKYVKRIWISALLVNYAEWMDDLQMCVIDRDYLLRTDVPASDIAQTIVHEGTHARLCKLKIKYTEDIRHRVERICIKSEISFAKRLPKGQKAVEIAERRLQIPPSYLTNDQFQQRDLDGLAELGKRFWPARLLYPIVKRKIEKRKGRLLSQQKN